MIGSCCSVLLFSIWEVNAGRLGKLGPEDIYNNIIQCNAERIEFENVLDQYA